MNIQQARSVLTLAETRQAHTAAERATLYRIAESACAVIDALNGVDGMNQHEAEDGLWDAIESHPAAPCFYHAARAAESFVPAMGMAA